MSTMTSAPRSSAAASSAMLSACGTTASPVRTASSWKSVCAVLMMKRAALPRVMSTKYGPGWFTCTVARTPRRSAASASPIGSQPPGAVMR
ncbi:MAG: hypothetical protein U1F43_38110 [Myxococcota bacterium]